VREREKSLLGGERREKVSVSEVDIGVQGAESEIKVKRRRGHERSAEDFTESVIEITSPHRRHCHCSARAYIVCIKGNGEKK